MDDKKQKLAANKQALEDAQRVIDGLLAERKAMLEPTIDEMQEAADMVRECSRDDGRDMCGMSDGEWMWQVLEQVEFAREEDADAE